MNINLRFWLRWSWRDLRARWLQVLAVSIIISLGTGIYAGLSGQRTWRENSYDDSYALLNMFDLKFKLASGSFISYDEVKSMLDDIEGIAAYEGRLQTATLVDASDAADDDSLLVPGVVIGVEPNPEVNSFFIRENAVIETGRELTNTDNGTTNALVPFISARQEGIEAGETLLISGDVTLDIVGAAMTPEYFMVVNPDSNNIFSIGNFFPVFVTLETAQDLTGREGMINNFVLTVEEGADIDAVHEAVKNAFDQHFEGVGVTVLDRSDDLIYTTLYEDAETDQGTWTIIAMMFLIGASFGVFNLAGRLVESQRRQIGIGMALGVPRLWLAFRPMLVGLQIALLGTIFGLVMGYFFSQSFGDLLDSISPMPIIEFSLYIPGFLIATSLGILLPLIATVIPVYRAVRVPPIDAIKTGHLVAKGGGLSGILNRVPLPGDSFMQMPFRNILRAPWRTMLTVAGIGIAIVLMVVFNGFLDSFFATMDKSEEALVYKNGDRTVVGLDFFYPTEEITPELTMLTNDAGESIVADYEAQIHLGGTMHNNGTEFPTLLDLMPSDSDIWTPRLLEGDFPASNGDTPGIIIGERAAEDLGVGVGDTITMEHPTRQGPFAFRLIESEMEVVGIHDNPIGSMSYMSIENADFMGLEGTTNSMVLVPTEDADADSFKRILLTQPNITSVDAVEDISKGLDDFLGLITAMLLVIAVVVAGMAFLISFNTTSINVDERVREIATMFAFGLPIRTVTRMQMMENFIIGVMATAFGIIIGWVLMIFTLEVLLEAQIEGIKLTSEIAPFTIVLAAVIGIVTVTITPLLSIRRMRKMDIPSELRVME